MKKLILSSVVLIAVALTAMAFKYPSVSTSVKKMNPPQEKVTPVFPEAVQKVLETSCFDCHSEASTNTKAKMKVNFSNWSEMSDSKKVGKMQDIDDILKKGDMPPKKYVTNYPDRAPGQEQKDIISKWVAEESAKLMGK